MKSVKEQVIERSIEHLDDLKGKKILLRVDMNVALGDNGIVDPGEDWRILQSLKTIQYLMEKDACVVVISHIGREKTDSLKPIFQYLSQRITLGFRGEYNETLTDDIENMPHGSVLMLENLRHNDGEEKNSIDFLKPVIDVCDIYVNDAFAVSHREHASVNTITQHLPSYFGLQFVDEVEHLSKILSNSEKTVTLLLGGFKFGTKLPLLEKMLPRVKFVLLGGALANVFLRERGFEIGASSADDSVDISSMRDNEKIILPIDYVDQHGDLASVDSVRPEDMILDIGHETESLFESVITSSDIVLWNGPMGKYQDGYVSGSVAMADALSKSQAFSIVGGGDTTTAVLAHGFSGENFDFVSTGGGAMLDFLVDGSLPGIDVIIKK